MTRITINLPLVDARTCMGCHMLVEWWASYRCDAFHVVVPLPHAARLPECLAAEVEEVERG